MPKSADPRHVRDLMTHDVVTLDANDLLTLAGDIMHLGRIRHMPVVDDGKLVGIISQRDLFRGALARSLGMGSVGHRRVTDTMLVKDAMATDLRTTTPDAELSSAARIMTEHKVGCLPVLVEGRLVGILTESDFVGHFARR